MKYWLVKSEPYKYSWQQFLKDKKPCGMEYAIMLLETIYER